MFNFEDYYHIARENETVFRNVLRDLRDQRAHRPIGCIVPSDLETDATLERIFEKYSNGERTRKFTIVSFSMPENAKAVIGFKDAAPLSGGGAELEYLVNADGSVIYDKPVMVLRSFK